MRINRWSDTGGMILIVQHSLLQTLLAEMSAPSFWRTMMTLTVEKHARISTEYSHDCELVTKKYRSGTKSNTVMIDLTISMFNKIINYPARRL
jgi:hypothetical protein